MKVQDILRVLNTQVRESKTKNEPLTIAELARRTNISEESIWLYIKVGKLDTMSLRDPRVRDYLRARGGRKSTSQRRGTKDDFVEEGASMKDILLVLKRQVRECNVIGEFLTVPELSHCTDVAESTIWHFIRSGQLDTISLDDPKVREFLLEKRRKLAAQYRKSAKDSEQQEQSEGRSKGFYRKTSDDKA